MNNIEFRPLKADEIEARVGSTTKTGKMLLLYKNARVDMALLDETVGMMNWKRDHEVIGGNLFCSISIYDESKKEWITKQDVGTESNAEKEKGQASDSFKRAGFNWGIGRELYTSPVIFINGDHNYFRVTRIGYTEDRVINDLQIVETRNDTVVYEMKDGKKVWINNKPNKSTAPAQARVQHTRQAYDTPAKTSANIKRSKASSGICSGCNVEIDDKVEWYSNEFYGKPLCRNCQGKNQRVK